MITINVPYEPGKAYLIKNSTSHQLNVTGSKENVVVINRVKSRTGIHPPHNCRIGRTYIKC